MSSHQIKIRIFQACFLFKTSNFQVYLRLSPVYLVSAEAATRGSLKQKSLFKNFSNSTVKHLRWSLF